MAHRPGRDRKKEVFWRRVIAGQPRSGLSVRAWCGRHEVRESSFYWWRRRLARRDTATAFVPVRLASGPSSAGADRLASSAGADDPTTASGGQGRIEIVPSQGWRVQVIGPVDRRALADVLAVLVDQGWGTQDALPEGMNGVRSRGGRSC